jgi:hypothetical protein
MKVTGVIESKEIKEGTTDDKAWMRTAFKINGKIFSTFDEGLSKEFRSGDKVEIEYEQKGMYSNIKEMKLSSGIEINEGVISEEETKVSPDVWAAKDRRIARESAIKSAVEFYGHLPDSSKSTINSPVDFTLEIADTFEKWIYRT